MVQLLGALDAFIATLRIGFTYALFVAAVLAALAWAVRTRRVNAFGAAARFVRTVIDPLVAPVERRAVRFGGSHATAPWWALLAFLLLGAVGIGVLGFLRDAIAATFVASNEGAHGVLRLGVIATFAVFQLALIVRVVMSWVGGAFSTVGQLATSLTEWFLAPLRRVLPRIGMIDISPLVAYFALVLVRGFVLGAL